jgi:hypothetical protein
MFLLFLEPRCGGDGFPSTGPHGDAKEAANAAVLDEALERSLNEDRYLQHQ